MITISDTTHMIEESILNSFDLIRVSNDMYGSSAIELFYNELGMRKFVESFRTIVMGLPRQVGKTTAIGNLCTEDDLVIFNSESDRKQFIDARYVQGLKPVETLNINTIRSSRVQATGKKVIYLDQIQDLNINDIDIRYFREDTIIISLLTKTHK